MRLMQLMHATHTHTHTHTHTPHTHTHTHTHTHKLMHATENRRSYESLDKSDNFDKGTNLESRMHRGFYNGQYVNQKGAREAFTSRTTLAACALGTCEQKSGVF